MKTCFFFSPRTYLPFAVAVIQMTFLLQNARAATWDGGGGAEEEWILPAPSPYANWGGINPAGTAVVFADSQKTTRAIPNNIVAQSLSIASLRYMNLGETADDWHVTQILLGSTLTVTSGLTVGGYSTGNFAAGFTRAAITGEGALTVGGSLLTIGSNGTDPAVGELDMSGLSSFNSTTTTFSVGVGRMNTGYLELARTNAITATTLTIGNSAGNNAASTRVSRMELGLVNTLKVKDIFIGGADFASATNGNRQSGELHFQTFGDSSVPSVVIRGKDSTELLPTASNLTVGKVGNDSTVNAIAVSVSATADFTGGTVDALLNKLVIGDGKNTAGTMTGSLSMDEGAIVAQEALVGRSTTGSTSAAGFATGNLNIAGGTFETGSIVLGENWAGGQKVEGNLNVTGGSVEITGTGGIVMGMRSGTAAEVRANVSVTGGGLLRVNGSMAKGTDTPEVFAKVTLDGGTLDMNGQDIRVDLFDLKSGVLENLKEFNAGATLLKSGTGTLAFEGINNHTGVTDVGAGTLLVNGSLAETGGVIVRNGATLGGTGSINEAASVQVESGGTVALSNNPSLLSIGSLELQPGAALALALNGPDEATGDYGQLHVAGSIDLDGADLRLTLGFAVTEGETFTILLNQGGGAIAGQFATVDGLSLTPDNRFTLDYNSTGYEFQLLYNVPGLGSGSDLLIRAIPEPESVWLGAVGAVLLCGMGRRFKRKRAMA